MPGIQIDALAYKRTFEKDLKKAPPDVQKAVATALEDLMKNPQPAKLRFHSLTGCFDPKILKIDVFSNRSWQITFEMDGTTAILRRLARHKTIDRKP